MLGSAFYQTESKRLAHIAARVGVLRAEIEDVVQDAWLKAFEHRDQFAGADVERRLRCWLRRVVYRKAVDARRHLGCCPCESLDVEGVEPADRAAAKAAEAAELGEWLEALVKKGGAGNEESLRLLCGHFLQERSIKELARESGLLECAVDGRIRRLLRKLRGLAE